MGWRVGRWLEIRGLEHGFGDRFASPPAGVRTVRQVHGTAILEHEEAGDGVEADGIVVRRPGERAGVKTADCVPVLIVAPDRRVALAVHAGWRGAAAGIVAAAVERLVTREGARLGLVEAALGPAIGGCCYEVGEEVRDAFAGRLGAAGRRGFTTRGGRLHLDLRRSIQLELEDFGVGAVERVGPCTACRGDLLHSFRKERATGRQISWVGWQPA